MHILIADNNKLPEHKYGGTQRVIWDLGGELIKMGHKVTYLVKEGSYCNFANILILDTIKPLHQQIPENVDIVHYNFEIPQEDLSEFKKPYLFTMHGNIGPDRTLPVNTVFVSQNHAERYGSSTYVYNGLNWDLYPNPRLSEKRSYYHFLGRANWKVKNMNGACVIANKANEKLVVMGGNRWNYTNLKRSFKFLLSPKVHFKGMVDNTIKMQVMNNSKGLIFPVRWHEPFGLAVIESLYSGCPVYATPYGSLKELVSPEVGVLSNSSYELASAIKNSSFSAKTCHEYAAENFNSRVMAEAYLKYYLKILEGSKLNTELPRLKEFSSQKLLPFE